MPDTRKDSSGHHGYLAPVAGIIALLLSYWLISEWNALPGLVSSALSTIH